MTIRLICNKIIFCIVIFVLLIVSMKYSYALIRVRSADISHRITQSNKALDKDIRLVQDKSNNISSDMFKLFSEMEWVDEKNTRYFEEQWDFKTRLEKMDLQLKEIKNLDIEKEFIKIENIDNSTNVRLYLSYEFKQVFLILTEISESSNSKGKSLKLLKQHLVNSGYDIERGKVGVNSSLDAEESVRNTLKDKIDLTKNELTIELSSKAEQVNNLLEKYSNIEQLLGHYKSSLRETLREFENRASLSSKLYWIIAVIGLLGIATIGIVRIFPNDVIYEWAQSGQVIQFVTVMILLSVIMSLGIAGLLKEQTLGTLLGGIGGYVLSQGVGKSAARTAIKEMQREINK